MSNGKSAEDDNIKSAADLLLKGGTLLSNSCENCGGVQVSFKENIVCVSCGRKVKEISVTQMEEEQKKKNSSNNNNNSDSGLSKEMKVQSNSDANSDSGGGGDGRLRTYEKVISKKITLLFTSLENDSDILIQNTKLDLISKYLDVLDKLKIVSKES
ncbi:MAG TPA: autoantigen p27 domain-containing protein [Nitrososphaeraceae archaeon]